MRRPLTDGERDILAEQEADARDVGACEPEDWYEVLVSAECLGGVWDALTGTTVELDPETPW